MAGPELGVVAAGHPLSARAGAEALRAGGNAVDAALGAMLTSFVCEPLLTGLGAGGYMLVSGPGSAPVLLDFFVEAPGRGAPPGQPKGQLVPVTVSFGDAVQVFNIGCASVGTPGVPAGLCAASARFGSMPLRELAAPAADLARTGVRIGPQQAYLIEILAGIVTATPEASALFAPGAQLLREGSVLRQPDLAAALERLGDEGAKPFYEGDIAAALAAWVQSGGGLLTSEDLAAYRVLDREPVRVQFRGREVLTNPPPSAGGLLIARALELLEDCPAPPSSEQIAAVMQETQDARTPEFLHSLDEPGFASRFLRRGGRLGSTTHIAVIDAADNACSVTCSAGSCSGVVVPGTGVHLNNMLGEQDLNPLGFHRYPPGRRLPSMMAPTTVLRDGRPQLVLGSAGSNRIRSAIVQTIVRALDEDLRAPEAVNAPRLHLEEGTVYAEPDVELSSLELAGRRVAHFRERNLFFGGVQVAERDAAGRFWGGGDPRRGGDAVVVSR